MKTENKTSTLHNKHLKDIKLKKSQQLKRLRLANGYLTKQLKKREDKIESLETQLNDAIANCEILASEVNDLSVKLGEYEAENDWLREMVNNADVIETFNHEKNCYSQELQECAFSLLENNVTSSKVSPVIESVLKLAKMKATRLPSRTTVNSMNVQRLVVSHRQIEEEFAQQPNTCLLSDETSKFGKQYQGFHAADEQGKTWCLGVREMATKGSETVLSTFKEILSDIDDVSSSCSKKSEEIMLNITSTMSDRAATQIKFNTLLEEFRTDIVVNQIGESWDTFSDVQRSQLTKLCNFFCSLHVLVHLAEAASTALLEYEKHVFEGSSPILDKSFCRATEPGAVRLIRTACKAFAAGGDEKSGMHGSFSTYTSDFLKEHHLRSVPLERFRGNRFNILFSSASHVHFLADEMNDFLSISANNRLLQAVKFDISNSEYLAGCKALGFVSELITVPLWSQIERTDTNIIDIGVIYREVVSYLADLDIEKFVKGEVLMSFVDKDKVNVSIFMKSLLKESTYDDKVIVILGIMIPALYNVTKRLFKDHLEGEMWDNPNASIREKTLATPNHNKFSETVFGVLDRILREKPNISIIAAESYILFCHNKTLKWLESKSEKDKEELLSHARKNVKKMRKKFEERQKMIEEQRKAKLNAARQKSEQIEKQRLKRKEGMTNDILIWGLWQSEADVDSEMESLQTQTDKRAAVTAQLRFRKNVLKQNVKDSCVYAMSKTVNGKCNKLSIQQLTDNVKTLVKGAILTDNQNHDGDTSSPIIVGKNIRHAQTVNNEKVWFSGKVISQVSN